MITQSISISQAVAFYRLAVSVMNGCDDAMYHKRIGALEQEQQLEYIEWHGQMPQLHNLQELDLEEFCPAYNLIDGIMSDIPDEKWDTLSDDEMVYLRYELPYYECLNQYLLPWHTRVVNINFGNENDFIIAVPTEDQEEWLPWQQAIDENKIRLQFFEPMDDTQVLEDIRNSLHINVE